MRTDRACDQFGHPLANLGIVEWIVDVDVIGRRRRCPVGVTVGASPFGIVCMTRHVSAYVSIKANPGGMTGFQKGKILPQPFPTTRKKACFGDRHIAGKCKSTPAEPFCSRELVINTFAFFG